MASETEVLSKVKDKQQQRIFLRACLREKVKYRQQQIVFLKVCLHERVCPKCASDLLKSTLYETLSPIVVYYCKNSDCKWVWQDSESEEGPYSWEYLIDD